MRLTLFHLTHFRMRSNGHLLRDLWRLFLRPSHLDRLLLELVSFFVRGYKPELSAMRSQLVDQLFETVPLTSCRWAVVICTKITLLSEYLEPTESASMAVSF